MITMSHRALPRYVACVAFVALTASARAQAPVHLESDAGWSHGSVSNGALDARLAAAARQYRSYAPVPRIAFFDLAYPKDSTEAAAMNGYAVLVVTAVVQDSTELPLPRVYVRSVSGDRDLPLVARVASGGGLRARRRVCDHHGAGLRAHRAASARSGPPGDRGSDARPYAQVFSSARHLLFQIEVDRHVSHRGGTWAIGANAGYMHASAAALAADLITRTGDETSLTLLPLSLSLVYRADVLRSFESVGLIIRNGIVCPSNVTSSSASSIAARSACSRVRSPR